MSYYNAYQQPSASDNPYHQPYAGPSYPSASSHHHAPVPANAYEYDVGIVAQQSVYVPGSMIDKRGGAGGKVAKGGKRTTVLRKGAGKVWEDQTLLDWNPCTSLPSSLLPPLLILSSSAWFRLFVGDLSNDVSEDVLASAFASYPSFQKAKVIRDRLSQKVRRFCCPPCLATCAHLCHRQSMALSLSPTLRTF